MFPKHTLPHPLLHQILSKKTITPTYIPIPQPLFNKNKPTIHPPIPPHNHHPLTPTISPTAQTALTHFHVIHTNKPLQITSVKLQLDTPRTHQSRVHLSS
ncbi:pseudouridine synthase, partial [Bacillus sp. WP8]|uniref:pseudouridine synthase n=1 Tax=Bacillus sp. WP8 TaxID=756828 RepID=UPI0037BE2A89